MTYRYLRIAWSVAWGILAVLLCVLWVRSYWSTGSLSYFTEGRVRSVHSVRGVVSLHYSMDARFQLARRGLGPQWKLHSAPLIHSELDPDDQEAILQHWPKPFRWNNRLPSSISISFPHWTLILLISLMGCAAWVMRFSLRALLIATTLVAVVLGAIVYAVR
jgi:hypothetical protein